MKYFKIVSIVIVVLLILVLIPDTASAQCAMCKATVENSGRSDGLNKGILYLVSMPYIAFGVIGYFWYKNTKKK